MERRVPGPTPINEPISRAPLTLRELRACELPACTAFLHDLDARDIKLRFGSPRPSIRHIMPDPARAYAAFAALDGSATILGVANLASLGADAAEVAIIIRSDHKRRGIGRSLLAHAILSAERSGVSRIIGYVDAENHAALALADAMGFLGIHWDSFSCEIIRFV
jgi:acetyltransferase